MEVPAIERRLAHTSPVGSMSPEIRQTSPNLKPWLSFGYCNSRSKQVTLRFKIEMSGFVGQIPRMRKHERKFYPRSVTHRLDCATGRTSSRAEVGCRTVC